MAERSLLLAGMGGQGIVFAASMLARALFTQGYYVSQLQSYGAEVRGGAVLGWVVYSEKPIVCPFIDNYELIVVLHQSGLNELKKKGLKWRTMIVDNDLVHEKIPGARLAPIHQAARGSGLEGLENMVALGLIASMGYVDMEALRQVIDTARDAERNLKALELGFKIIPSRNAKG